MTNSFGRFRVTAFLLALNFLFVGKGALASHGAFSQYIWSLDLKLNVWHIWTYTPLISIRIAIFFTFLFKVARLTRLNLHQYSYNHLFYISFQVARFRSLFSGRLFQLCVVVAVGKLRVNELCAGQELSRIEKKIFFNLLHVKNYLNGVDYNTIVGKLYPIRG